MIINGTQKLMNCPEIKRIVTIMFNNAVQIMLPSNAVSPRPIRMPATRATTNLNGKELVKEWLLLMINIKPPVKKI